MSSTHYLGKGIAERKSNNNNNLHSIQASVIQHHNPILTPQKVAPEDMCIRARARVRRKRRG